MITGTGVDLYRYQTVTDYRLLSRSIKYAWVKLTDGNGPAAVKGDAQVNGCRGAGIPVGGYHYAQPPGLRLANGELARSATYQAQRLIDEVERLGARDIAPALDLEGQFSPNNSARSFSLEFCRAVADAGHRPAVYMSASWAGSLRPDLWSIPGLVIWIAAYGANDGTWHPAAVSRYYPGAYHVHQYTSTGHVPGVSGLVDVNMAEFDITNTAVRKDDRMRNLIIAREVDANGVPVPSGQHWVGDGITRRKVADPKELEGLIYWIGQQGGNNKVQDFADLRVLGAEDTAAEVELDYARFVEDTAEKLASKLNNTQGRIIWGSDVTASTEDPGRD